MNRLPLRSDPTVHLSAAKDGIGEESRDPPFHRDYHYGRVSNRLRPHYRRLSEADTRVREEIEADQRPTALSPTTKRFLAEAMSLPMNAEDLSASGLFPLTDPPAERVLSVASASVYSEPEIETVPDMRKSTQSGWYSKSIFKSMFPNKG